ncbi:ribbon-helix-helix protein, CopG family [Agromyces neolithicus]|uniref:Ribbon-helix-helix domain-containing protein n=1 Tax=Agromyces neolithicus TaxID=269420 RepID=A0ABN2M9D3_9MICO
MRTTVILPDELYRQVKERARAEDRTVTSFLEEALRRALAYTETVAGPADAYLAEPFSPRSGEGGTLPGVDITDNARLHDILDEGLSIEKLR